MSNNNPNAFGEKDLIYRQAAIDAAMRLSLGETDATRLAMRIGDYLERLPSAQPELIRCKDCKHRPIATRADEGVLWGFSVEFPDERCPLQCEDGWYNHYPKDDFYCANAERRTDEAD